MQERLEIYPLEDNDVKLLHIPYSYSGDFFPKKSSHHALDMTVMYVNSFIYFFRVSVLLCLVGCLLLLRLYSVVVNIRNVYARENNNTPI